MLFAFEISDFDFDLVAALGGHSDLDCLVQTPIDGGLFRSEDDGSGTLAFEHEIAVTDTDAAADELPGYIGGGEEVLPDDGLGGSGDAADGRSGDGSLGELGVEADGLRSCERRAVWCGAPDQKSEEKQQGESDEAQTTS